MLITLQSRKTLGAIYERAIPPLGRWVLFISKISGVSPALAAGRAYPFILWRPVETEREISGRSLIPRSFEFGCRSGDFARSAGCVRATHCKSRRWSARCCCTLSAQFTQSPCINGILPLGDQIWTGTERLRLGTQRKGKVCHWSCEERRLIAGDSRALRAPIASLSIRKTRSKPL